MFSTGFTTLIFIICLPILLKPSTLKFNSTSVFPILLKSGFLEISTVTPDFGKFLIIDLYSSIVGATPLTSIGTLLFNTALNTSFLLGISASL